MNELQAYNYTYGHAKTLNEGTKTTPPPARVDFAAIAPPIPKKKKPK